MLSSRSEPHRASSAVSVHSIQSGHELLTPGDNLWAWCVEAAQGYGELGMIKRGVRRRIQSTCAYLGLWVSVRKGRNGRAALFSIEMSGLLAQA